MNINKKLDRMKHWAGEKMGGEVKTNTSDEFKALEMEMQLRSEGMERLHRTMNVYIKSLSKRNEGDDKEKLTAISQLGSTATQHADDFEPDSEFGQCLSSFGRANERIARMQDSYVVAATSSWLEGLERSLAQMKEYQAARKKLDSRRLAFDTSQTKLQKAKKEDFRMEEELRSQKAKYEESNEDVYRRMLDIKEAEVDSIADLSAFLDAELNYYDRAREILLQLKQDWPASPEATQNNPSNGQRRHPRSRASTLSTAPRHPEDEPSSLAVPIRSRVASAQTSATSSPLRERSGFDFPSKPLLARHNTTQSALPFEGPRSLASTRDGSPASLPRLSRVPTENSVMSARNTLRPIKTRDSYISASGSDVFADTPEEREGEDYYNAGARSASPAPSWRSGSGAIYGNGGGADGSMSAGGYGGARKMAPPPPPPSRSKKPPPPAPPLKRSALSTSDVPRV